MKCRFCGTELKDVFIDMINSPASNSFLTFEQLNEPEIFYPLKVYTCPECLLVQIDEYKKSNEIFSNDYVYYSSYSKSWLEHSKRYVENMMNRFSFDQSSLIIEIASNDGYLLQYFQEKEIPVLGVEPTMNTAEVARKKGIESINDFFGVKLAEEMVKNGIKADLLIGNNVLPHVPDIVDFVKGMKKILKENGIITMEFPHLMNLVDNNLFDTIYHEHFSYLSFATTKRIFEAQGLEIFDVEEITTHGGSLRIYAKHSGNRRQVSLSVNTLLQKEKDHGMNLMPYYKGFQEKALKAKMDLIEFLIDCKREGKKVAAYGAAAKGNTILNYCGIKSDLIQFVVDANPFKQNKYLPASHIPVKNESYLKVQKPDIILILPWNLKDEICTQLKYIREWNGKFAIAIPELQIF